MVGALSGAVAVALLAGTGLAVAATLGVRGWARLVLGAYVFALAEIVGVVLVLSPFAAVRRPSLLASVGALAVAAAALWWRAGRGLPRAPRLGFVRDSGPLAALAAGVALVLAYIVALVVGTAPNTWDSLVYHLTRAAVWRQEGAAGYVEAAYDGRLNANPPNAEIALAFVLELTHSERFAGFVQLSAALACVVAVYALSRRLGFLPHEAAFGSLLVLTLPIVTLQASTTQNDLVVAAFLLAATVFVLGEPHAHIGLAGLATALAMGTKVTAGFALPLLALVALVGPPRDARFVRLGALALGALIGSYWYVVNLARTGDPLGERPDTDLLALGELRENVLSAFARVLDAFDLSGSEGNRRFVLPGLADSDILVYVVAALALAIGLLGVGAIRGRPSPHVGVLAGALTLLPLMVSPLAYLVWRVLAKLHDVLGSGTAALPAGEAPSQTVASESVSWFGPLGPFLLSGALVASVLLYRRRSLPTLAIVFAAAPFAWLVLLSMTLHYDVWQGRFFVYPVALSATVWGFALRWSAGAWAVLAIGMTTAALSLVNSLEKPSGLRLFAGSATESVWRMERWELQSLPRPGVREALRFAEERIPENESVAVALAEDDFGYPYFGRELRRRIELAGSDPSTTELASRWLVASASRVAEIDKACWGVRLESEAVTVYKRVARTCRRRPG